MTASKPAVWVAEVGGRLWVSADGPRERPKMVVESPNGALTYPAVVTLEAVCQTVMYLGDDANPRDLLDRRFPATFRRTDGDGLAEVACMVIESVSVMPKGGYRFANLPEPNRQEYDVTVKAKMVR